MNPKDDLPNDCEKVYSRNKIFWLGIYSKLLILGKPISLERERNGGSCLLGAEF